MKLRLTRRFYTWLNSDTGQSFDEWCAEQDRHDGLAGRWWPLGALLAVAIGCVLLTAAVIVAAVRR